jgi:hypothetical protein
MDYKNFAIKLGLIVLGAAGLIFGYLTLRIYVAPLIPFIADYPSSIIIPYVTIIFAIVAYCSRRDILFTLQMTIAAFLFSSAHVAFNMYFLEYREVLTLSIFIIVILKHYFGSGKAS